MTENTAKGSRPENKCTNCSLRRTRCKCGRGVVIWTHCERFRPSPKVLETKKVKDEQAQI